MESTAKLPDTSSVADQLAGVVVDGINAARLADEVAQLANQDQAFLKALGETAKVREFVNAPEHILGSGGTKHGEVAEQLEVGVRRAREILVGTEPTATFEGVGRLAPEDYRIAGVDVQSKFINGTNNTLNHVLEHMEKCGNFGRDGSYYHIPKDQYAQIQDVLKGHADGLSEKTVRAFQEKVQQIELETGKAFEEVVKPSVSTYPEVQLGRVNETLDGHDSDLKLENEALKGQIQVEHQPSLAEGLKAAGTAAAVGAAVSFTMKAWGKYREGKNLFKGDFTVDDWKDVGGAAFKGAVGGAIAGGAIYALTNCAGLSAPFAGAFVSAAKGVASLVADYHAGKISLDALIDEGLFVCSDAAIVGLCTAAGQTLIPIPVVGAVLGSIAGKLLSTFLGKQMRAAQVRLDSQLQNFRTALGAKFQKVMAELEARISELGDLTTAAFDLQRNEELVTRSVALAQAYGVSEGLILKNESNLDAFMGG
ncbi:hypothetical protein ACQUJT_24395 [Ralstonia pseudosolanacearum]